jgi:hypothetical protein
MYNTAMTEPLTKKTFHELCKQWADVINRCESGIQMWPPIGGAHLRIKQFIADTPLQNELFGKEKPICIFVDANEVSNFAFADFEKQIREGLPHALETFSLASYLQINPQKLVIFFTGFDTALKNNGIDALNHIGGLTQKYDHFSIILCTETNLLESQLIKTTALKSAFLQNIFFAPLYTEDDARQFFTYLEEKWQCSFDKKKTATLAKEIGGHFWLLKEAARILRAHPVLSVKELLASQTLVSKGLTLYRLLDKNDQETILHILRGEKPFSESDYLSQTNLITRLSYWHDIKEYLLRQEPLQQNLETNLDIYFTSLERDVFELLLDKKGIVTRQEIAQVLWQENWEERYSDWAIDQVMYRIRKKIVTTNAPYQLITKKGEGFVLVSQ